MTRTKVLVITPQYAPDFGPSAPIYTALCEDLQKFDYDVTVITGFPHYNSLQAQPQTSRKFYHEEILNGVRILRTYIYAVLKSVLWQRLLYHATYNISATVATLQAKKPDIVLADAPTLWSGLPLLVTAILPRVPFIYIVHDIYPDVLVRLGVITSPVLVNMIGRIEHFYYDRSAQISVLSDGFRENLMQKGVSQNKITVIPACVDVEFIHPLLKVNDLCKKWRLEGKNVVLYAGNIGFSQGLEIMLDAAQLLIDHSNIVFVLVGEGAAKSTLESMAEDMHLSNVLFFSFQPREDVPLVYALADVCLVSLRRNIVAESVPSKTYSIMASGRPIIATVHGDTEIAQLIQRSRCGLRVEPENPAALAQAIIYFYTNASVRVEMGKNGRDYVVEHYSRRVASEKYFHLIQSIVCRE